MTIATRSLPTSGFIRSGVCITTSLLRTTATCAGVIGPASRSLRNGCIIPTLSEWLRRAHGRNGRDPAVDQEVCPDDVRGIVRRQVNCQLRDLQRIGDPLAWIVGS